MTYIQEEEDCLQYMYTVGHAAVNLRFGVMLCELFGTLFL